MSSSGDSTPTNKEKSDSSDSDGSSLQPERNLIHTHRKHHSKHHKEHHKHHQHEKSLPDEEIELSLPPSIDLDHRETHEEQENHDLEHHDTVFLTSPVPPSQEMRTACGGRVYVDTLKLIHVATCFMILLAAFSTTSSLVGPIFQQVGILSLGIQNLGFSVGSLVAPSIVGKIGVRLTMVISASVYVGYMAILQLNIIWVFLVTSFIRGFSGGTLWNAQAVYLSNLCERHPGQTGRLSGLFFGVFSFQVLVGSLIMGIPLLLSPDTPSTPQDPVAALNSMRTMLWVLTGLGGLAVVLFAFLRPVEPLKSYKPEPFWSHIKDTFSLFKRRDMRLLLVWAFMFGYVICFMWGPVSTLYGNLRLTPMLFVGFGAAFTISSFVTGKIYDSKGWKPLLLIYLVAHVLAYIAFSVGYTLKVDAWFYIAAIMFGWIESELGTLNEAVFIEVFSECTSHAFALGNFIQSFGQAVAYIMSAYMNHWIILGINVGLLVIGSATLWIGMSTQAKQGPSRSPKQNQVTLAKVLSPKAHHR